MRLRHPDRPDIVRDVQPKHAERLIDAGWQPEAADSGDTDDIPDRNTDVAGPTPAADHNISSEES